MAYSFRNPVMALSNVPRNQQDHRCSWITSRSLKIQPVIVSAKVQERGYRIIPVNPRAAGGPRSLEKRCMLACRRSLPSRYRRCIPSEVGFTRCV